MYTPLKEHLEWESSDVDWCEENYFVSENIVEFYNTISNAPFILLPLVVMYLSREYSRLISRDLNFICVSAIIVGISSAYFHATLSHFGQLLDEMAILWANIVAIAFWLPVHYFQPFIGPSRQKFQKLMIFVCVVCTSIWCVFPAINMFALMVLSLILIRAMNSELQKYQNTVEYRTATRSMVLWLIGMALWAVDMFYCTPTISRHYPYLHALFHVMAVMATLPCAVVFALFEARKSHPDATAQARVAFFPSWSGEFGIPHITIQANDNSKNTYSSLNNNINGFKKSR